MAKAVLEATTSSKPSFSLGKQCRNSQQEVNEYIVQKLKSSKRNSQKHGTQQTGVDPGENQANQAAVEACCLIDATWLRMKDVVGRYDQGTRRRFFWRA